MFVCLSVCLLAGQLENLIVDEILIFFGGVECANTTAD